MIALCPLLTAPVKGAGRGDVVLLVLKSMKPTLPVTNVRNAPVPNCSLDPKRPVIGRTLVRVKLVDAPLLPSQ